MIIINRDEAMALRAKYGDEARITITSRTKKGGRKKYYASEEHRNVAFIERYRYLLSKGFKVKELRG